MMRPGSWIIETQLWPDGTYPATPLLLEHAGAENPGKGWARHQSDDTVVLWRYDRAKGEFVEIGRVAAPGGVWPQLMEPLARDWLSRDLNYQQPERDLELTRSRIMKFLAQELDAIPDADRARVLTLVHDELAGRIAEWGEWVSGSAALSHSPLSLRI